MGRRTRFHPKNVQLRNFIENQINNSVLAEARLKLNNVPAVGGQLVLIRRVVGEDHHVRAVEHRHGALVLPREEESVLECLDGAVRDEVFGGSREVPDADEVVLVRVLLSEVGSEEELDVRTLAVHVDCVVLWLDDEVLGEGSLAHTSDSVPVPVDSSVVRLSAEEIHQSLLPGSELCDDSDLLGESPASWLLVGVLSRLWLGAVVDVLLWSSLGSLPVDLGGEQSLELSESSSFAQFQVSLEVRSSALLISVAGVAHSAFPLEDEALGYGA